MHYRDIVVIGSSAGGVEALRRLCAALPRDFPARIFIVQHLSPSAPSALPQLLQRVSPLRVTSPAEGTVTAPGTIYVAAPDRHMLLRPGHVLMRRGPHENRTRPAVDALFRSAAIAYGARVIGVVLTGLLDDGTEGLIAIKAGGGVSIAQEPADAEWPSMPANAIRRAAVDHIVKLDDLAALLVRLVREPAGTGAALPPEFAIEDRIAAQEFAVMTPEIVTPGVASRLGCPDCGGVLNEIRGSDAPRFRCQIGHAFTALGLAAAQNQELERALGVAVRTHRDRIRLYDRMRENAQARGHVHSHRRWQDAADESTELIGVLERAMASLHTSLPDVEA